MIPRDIPTIEELKAHGFAEAMHRTEIARQQFYIPTKPNGDPISRIQAMRVIVASFNAMGIWIDALEKDIPKNYKITIKGEK